MSSMLGKLPRKSFGKVCPNSEQKIESLRTNIKKCGTPQTAHCTFSANRAGFNIYSLNPLLFLCGCIGRRMFCLHGVYSVLQDFDGFLVVGYLPMQAGVLPLQHLDLVTAEKRTDTLGDVGGCDGCRPFQLLDLCFFFARLSSSRAVSFCCCKSTTSALRSSASFCISR